MERPSTSPVKGQKSRKSNGSPVKGRQSEVNQTVVTTTTRKSVYYEEKRGIKEDVIEVDHLKQII